MSTNRHKMIYTKEQLILRVSCSIDEINRELDRCPDISDIPDDAFTDEECDLILENNLALLKALKTRNLNITFIAKQVRERGLS